MSNILIDKICSLVITDLADVDRLNGTFSLQLAVHHSPDYT